MFQFTENNYNNFQFLYQVGLNKHETSNGKLTKIRLKYKHIANMELEKNSNYLLKSVQYSFKFQRISNIPTTSMDIITVVSSNFEEIIFLFVPN